MIRLLDIPKPTELTDELVAELTAEFKADNAKRVWDKRFIKMALLQAGREKCAFCECLINEESKYMEVEHFKHKSLYKDDVVNWDNLLPSCKRCNAKKGLHDVVLEPIINPKSMDPQPHLYFQLYRIKGKSEIGKTTENILDLNDRNRLVTPRSIIGDKIVERIENIFDQIMSSGGSNRIYRQLENLISEGHPDKEYAATVATVLLNTTDYIKLKGHLIDNDLWTPELQAAEDIAKTCALEYR